MNLHWFFPGAASHPGEKVCEQCAQLVPSWKLIQRWWLAWSKDGTQQEWTQRGEFPEGFGPQNWGLQKNHCPEKSFSILRFIAVFVFAYKISTPPKTQAGWSGLEAWKKQLRCFFFEALRFGTRKVEPVFLLGLVQDTSVSLTSHVGELDPAAVWQLTSWGNKKHNSHVESSYQVW